MRLVAAAVVLLGMLVLIAEPALAAGNDENKVPDATVTTHEPGPLSKRLLTLDNGIVLAGALSPEVLATADTLTIVDLRTPAEGTAEEAEAASAAGHSYYNLPVPGAVVQADTVAALKKILDDPDRSSPVVVHCASGNRAALLYGAVALERGEPLEVVQAELEPLLTSQGAIDALAAEAEPPGAEPQ